MENFGLKLQTLRKKTSMSQDDLASLIGVSRQAISKWERSDGLPDLYNVKKIAEVFNITIDELLDEEKKAKTSMSSDGELNNQKNKLSIILINIPSFLFLLGLPVFVVGSIVSSIVMLVTLFELDRFDISVNLQVIYYPVFTLICYILIRFLIDLYKGKNSKNTRLYSIVSYAFLIIGYLSLLITFRISGFGPIFLYLIGLLLLITGLVGFLIYDPSCVVELPNLTSKIQKIVTKVVVIISIATVLLIPIQVFKNDMLIKDIDYLAQVSRTDGTDIQGLFQINALGDLEGYQVYANLRLLLPEGISAPHVKLYINDILITEGDAIEFNASGYVHNYQFFIDFEEGKQGYVINKHETDTFEILQELEISYIDSFGSEVVTRVPLGGNSTFSYDVLEVWSWNYGKYFE